MKCVTLAFLVLSPCALVRKIRDGANPRLTALKALEEVLLAQGL